MRLCLALCLMGAASLPLKIHAAERVVTLAPHLAELVCAAGACDQLVGSVKRSDYPESVKALPKVGDAFAVNAEALIALKPTLVLVWDGGTAVQTIAQVEQLGLRVARVRIEKLEHIAASVRRIGALLGTSTAAEIAASKFEQDVTQLRSSHAQRASLRVFYQLQVEPMFTVSAGSPISQALRLCGAENIFGDIQQLAGSVSREAVIARNPDVIVFSDEENQRGIRQSWSNFPSVRAVADQNLLVVRADLLARATPRMTQGITQLCEVLDQARARRDTNAAPLNGLSLPTQ